MPIIYGVFYVQCKRAQSYQFSTRCFPRAKFLVLELQLRFPPPPSSHASDITRRGQRLGSVCTFTFHWLREQSQNYDAAATSPRVASRLAHAPMQCCSTNNNNNNSEVTIMQCHNSKQLQQLLLESTKCGCSFLIILNHFKSLLIISIGF